MEDDETIDPAPDSAVMESLLAFWADAGVEYAYADAPVDRLAPPPAPPRHADRAPPAAAQRPPTPARPAPPPAAELAPEVDRARALAEAAPDLKALQAALEAFDSPLRPRGAAIVFSRGPANPTVVVVGQGPGPEDADAAFGGRAGRLMDRMLAAAGLEGRALLLNTGFWRAGGRVTPAEVEAISAPFLERAVALARPRALLMAGEGALRALTGPGEPIMTARGRWLEWSPAGAANAGPLPALPIFHPEFLMRHPAAKKRAWADLLLLTERLARA